MNNFTVKEQSLFYKDVLVSDAIDVIGLGRSDEQDNWSTIVRFHDPDGVQKELSISNSDLSGNWQEVLKTLSDLGFRYYRPKLLKIYLTDSESTARYRLIKNTGWRGKDVFVLPASVIGTPGEQLKLITDGHKNEYTCSGTLQDWQDHIARYCVGNDRLILGVSLALAGPLLEKIGLENGGIHLLGQSSTGKSTIAKVASSVWGGSDFMKNWRMTDNALEFLAASRNDTHLGIDELNQADTTKAGRMNYLLGNGEGKTRSSASGGYRKAVKWRLLVLSTGEKGFAECAEESKGRYKAGQEVRMVELPACGEGYAYGAFQNDHGLGGGKGLSEYLNASVHSYYGTPAISFLEKLVQLPSDQIKELFKTLSDRMHDGLYQPDGQVSRVAKRFGLIATAGVLAIRFGILPWDQEETIAAIKRCFDEWVRARGGQTSHEETALLEQVKLFMEQYAESRFPVVPSCSCSGQDNTLLIPSFHGQMAGYKRMRDDESWEYLIFPGVMKKEICKGVPFQFAKTILCKHGWLLDKKAPSIRFSPSDQRRVYQMTSQFWDYNSEHVSFAPSVSST